MILASQSPRRQELLSEAGYAFRTVPARVDETPLPHETPLELVNRLAQIKALAIAEQDALPGELVIAADTIVFKDNTILGKPRDVKDAQRMLHILSGETHHVATGVCIAQGGRGVLDTFTECTAVTFYDLTDAQIEAYVRSGEPMDKAGAYGIQGYGGRLLVRGIKGDFYTVVGLPIAELVRRLERCKTC